MSDKSPPKICVSMSARETPIKQRQCSFSTTACEDHVSDPSSTLADMHIQQLPAGFEMIMPTEQAKWAAAWMAQLGLSGSKTDALLPEQLAVHVSVQAGACLSRPMISSDIHDSSALLGDQVPASGTLYPKAVYRDMSRQPQA